MARAPKITYTTLSADESIHPKYEAALKKFAAKQLGKHHPMHIGAKEVRSDAGEFEHRSPIDTSIVVSYFPIGQREHAKQAIDAGKRAFPAWSGTPWRERVRILRRAAELIGERKFEIAAAITYEVGKNRLEALAEAWEAIDAINLYAKVMEENKGYSKETKGAPGEHGKIIAKPLGVWPVISPFNFPFMLANGMATGALLTGNAVVLKPTSEAPLTGLMLYKVYRDAGVPAGKSCFPPRPAWRPESLLPAFASQGNSTKRRLAIISAPPTADQRKPWPTIPSKSFPSISRTKTAPCWSRRWTRKS